jgi:hypothetical protein
MDAQNDSNGEYVMAIDRLVSVQSMVLLSVDELSVIICISF